MAKAAQTAREFVFRGVQGRRQFLLGRKRILDAFDAARTESKAHEVEVHHGKVAEAQFRRWLKSFLPIRYGVTAGYVVSQALPETERLPHYDVIIYDRLESPVLWIEENPDTSPGNESRAVPAEFVCAVIEVKSAFSSATATSALNHLNDLSSLLSDVDIPGERYPKYLPMNFFRSVVFVELRHVNRHDAPALKQFLQSVGGRGYFGSLILRGEGLHEEYSGRIEILRWANTPAAVLGALGRDLLQGYARSESEFIHNSYFSSQLRFSQNEFTDYAFDVLALLRGTYQPGRMSSFHASSFVDVVPGKDEERND